MVVSHNGWLVYEKKNLLFLEFLLRSCILAVKLEHGLLFILHGIRSLFLVLWELVQWHQEGVGGATTEITSRVL